VSEGVESSKTAAEIDRSCRVVRIDGQRIGGIREPVDESGSRHETLRRARKSRHDGRRPVGEGEPADPAGVVILREKISFEKPPPSRRLPEGSSAHGSLVRRGQLTRRGAEVVGAFVVVVASIRVARLSVRRPEEQFPRPGKQRRPRELIIGLSGGAEGCEVRRSGVAHEASRREGDAVSGRCVLHLAHLGEAA